MWNLRSPSFALRQAALLDLLGHAFQHAAGVIGKVKVTHFLRQHRHDGKRLLVFLNGGATQLLKTWQWPWPSAKPSTLLMTGLSSSLSIGMDVLWTHVLVHRWRNRTNEDLEALPVSQRFKMTLFPYCPENAEIPTGNSWSLWRSNTNSKHGSLYTTAGSTYKWL